MKQKFLERDFQGLVTKYMKANAWGSFPVELKISKGKTVAFSKFECQQLPSLLAAKQGNFVFKLTDASLGLKPFDMVVYSRCEAYVGIMFEVDKQQDTAYFIEINKVMELKDSGAKSISLAFAKDNGIAINLNPKA